MKKKVLSALLCVSMVATMAAGCGSSDEGAASNAGEAATGTEAAAPAASGETIALKVWAAEEDQTLTLELIEKFKDANPDQDFNITIGVESEANAKDDILVDPEAAADVFAFASDQITDLVKAGVLQPVQDVETISSENVAGSVEAATVDDTLYAYPFSADNGYFLYYDSTVVTDPTNWDAILADCDAAGKKAGMVMASGWYNAGFFYGAGFTTELNADGSTTMDWNGSSPSGINGTDSLTKSCCMPILQKQYHIINDFFQWFNTSCNIITVIFKCFYCETENFLNCIGENSHFLLRSL